MLNTEIYQKVMNIYCSMKTKVVESSITTETVSENAVFGEVEEPTQDKISERAKKALRVPNKDKEQIDDKSIRKPNYLLKVIIKEKLTSVK